MLHISPVSRKELDRWPVSESGLPPRVVHCASQAGIHTMGELRTWPQEKLMKLRSLGNISMRQIEAFFQSLEELEQGSLQFRNFSHYLSSLLDKNEAFVLTGRYGLQQSTLKVSSNFMTLQEVGNLKHITRERVRQVEANAKSKLSSRLARHWIEPFLLYCRERIEEAGMAQSPEETALFYVDPYFSGLNPAGLLTLCHDVHPHFLTTQNGYFSNLDREVLDTCSSQALTILEQAREPLPLATVQQKVQKRLPRDYQPTRQVIKVMLWHEEEVTATTSDDFFITELGLPFFLESLLRETGEPLHYRKITTIFNERVLPRKQRGCGYILEHLNKSAVFRKVDRGIYGL